MDEIVEQEYTDKAVEYVEKYDVPAGADAAFIAGVEYGAKLRDEDIKSQLDNQ